MSPMPASLDDDSSILLCFTRLTECSRPSGRSLATGSMLLIECGQIGPCVSGDQPRRFDRGAFEIRASCHSMPLMRPLARSPLLARGVRGRSAGDGPPSKPSWPASLHTHTHKANPNPAIQSVRNNTILFFLYIALHWRTFSVGARTHPPIPTSSINTSVALTLLHPHTITGAPRASRRSAASGPPPTRAGRWRARPARRSAAWWARPAP